MTTEATQPERKKTGPKPGGKTGTKTIEGRIVGRDKTVVPPEEVFKLAQIGCKDREIADWFGIKEDTLRYNFADNLLKGRESMKQSLRRAMWNNALHNNNTVMQIFLSKNFLGMSDTGMNSGSEEVLPWTD